MIDELLRLIEGLRKSIAKNRSININSPGIKKATLEIAKAYFDKFRPHILERRIDGDSIKILDNDFPRLITSYARK